MESPCVRFDDLSNGGSGSFGLLDPAEAIIARRIDDVVPALQAAEQAARDGHWVAGYVSYEAAPAFDEMLVVRPPGIHDPMRDLPLVQFRPFRRRVDLDHIDSLQFPAGAYNVSAWSADSSHDDYKEALALIGRSIMSGEVAQLTHTFRLHAAFNGDAAALYRDLLLSQRGPHAVCMEAGRFRVVSASPENFFRRDGNRLTLNPILATTRRGRWLEEDLHLAGILRAEGEETYTNRMVVKEIEAELVELGEPVPPPPDGRFHVDRFETVWHLKAEIETLLRDDIDLVAVFRALFPAVSATGVPKPEAMALLAGAEDTSRGVYCGAIGYLAPTDGAHPSASFNVAIRTVVIDEDEGVAEFGVGTPITNRSDVVSAYEEARLKAKVLVDRRPEFQILENLRVSDGVAIEAERAVDRIVSSSRYFGFAVEAEDTSEVIRNAAKEITGDRWLSVLIDREGTATLDVAEAPSWCDDPEQAAVLIGALAEQPVSSENVFLFHRTSDTRLPDLMARQYPDVDTVVLVNELDQVVGSLDGNVVALIDGEWITPPLDCGTVATSMRQNLVAGGSISERYVTRDEIIAAEKVTLIDDIHGWRIVGLVG